MLTGQNALRERQVEIFLPQPCNPAPGSKGVGGGGRATLSTRGQVSSSLGSVLTLAGTARSSRSGTPRLHWVGVGVPYSFLAEPASWGGHLRAEDLLLALTQAGMGRGSGSTLLKRIH